ncbi:hypothetical protein AAE485_03240 [Acidithiobacillus ferriphilus]|uniref:hypothetical protein n=1 Tax=Acidithiobacillus ferriphilus TaxID=1689834 RepID=UPI00390CD03D
MKNYTQSSVYREKTTKKDNGDNPYNYQHGLLPLNQPAPFERKEERGKRKEEKGAFPYRVWSATSMVLW